MNYPAPASSQVSEIYDAVTILFQKLQSLSPRVYGTLDVNFTTQDGKSDTAISRGYLLIIQIGRNILSLKTEVGGPKAQDDAARSPVTTFHRFRELPAEVRVMTWKLALQTPRIFRLNNNVQFGSWLPIINPHKPPACAQACREPRTIFKAEAKQLFGLNGGIYKSLWFSPSKDIVYWEKRTFVTIGLGLENYGHDFPDIQNLAVGWPGDDGSDSEVLLGNVSTIFPGCKRLIMVMEHPFLPDGGDVSFTKVKDDDEMNILFSEDFCQWGEIRRELSERFPLHGKQEIPNIEAVEVTPVRK
jgi:hypothetical protein